MVTGPSAATPRYANRDIMTSATPEDLKRWDRAHYWHAFTQMAEYEPLVIERAEGAWLIDSDGRRLLDGVSSLWCNVHGHRHPHIDRAVREQLERVAHTTALGSANATTIRLAKRLADLAPGDLQHVFFSSDGASAVEVALKMAFQYWQQRCDPRPEKTRFAALGGAYHGDTLGCVSVGGVERFHALFGPLLFDVVRLPMPDLDRLPEGVSRAAANQYYLQQAEQLLAQHHHELAAVIVEPLVQGAAGMVVHPEGYLRGLGERARQHDVLLIADEVAVGMGRTGTMFACEQEQVVPDILCLGKGLTGGYLPMAATLANDEIFRAFLGPYGEAKQFFHGHTYGGNPLAAAAALATLEVFDQEETLQHLPAKAERMAGHLQRIAQHPHVGHVRQRGLLAGIELVADKQTRRPFEWAQKRGQQVCDHAITLGVWLRPLGNVVVIMPPLSITHDQLDRILWAAEAGIAATTGR